MLNTLCLEFISAFTLHIYRPLVQRHNVDIMALIHVIDGNLWHFCHVSLTTKDDDKDWYFTATIVHMVG